MKYKVEQKTVSPGFFSKFKIEIILTVLCFIFYGNTLKNGYSLDDDFVTNNNIMVKGGLKAIPEIFSSRYATEGKFTYEYRPLVKATYALEYWIVGTSPATSHFLNVLLYALACVILFRLLSYYFVRYGKWFPFFVSLLFLVHPIHVEVVASLKNRDGLLSFIFFMLTLRSSLAYINEGKAGKLGLAFIFYLAGMLSKIDVLTILAIIPLSAYYLFEKPWKRTAVIVSCLLLVNVLFFLFNKNVLPDSYRYLNFYENPLFIEKGFLLRVGALITSLVWYIKMSFLPYPLLFYYGYNQVEIVAFPSLIQVVCLIGIAAIIAFVIKGVINKKMWAFGGAWFFITVSMFTNFYKPVVGIVADRFLFLPSIGICIIIILALNRLFNGAIVEIRPVSRFTWLVGIIVLVTFVQVYSRNKDWNSFYTLAKNDVRILIRSAKANDLYGLAASQEALATNDPVLKKELIKESLYAYKKAVEIYPEYVSVYNSIGSIYVNFEQNYKEAIPYFKKALDLDSSYLQAGANLAFCLQKNGKLKEAELIYKEITEKDTGRYLNAFFNLGELYFNDNRFDEALSLQLKAAALFPKSDLPWVSMGNYYLLKGDTVNAVEKWERALQVYPQNEKLAGNLSMYFYSKGDQTKYKYYRKLAETARSKQ